MDDFEESFGDWSQDDKDDFDWSRHSGSWISSSSGPRRDHTLGTHFGHYLIFEGGTHAEGQIARLVSPEFIPTQNSDCKVRFYYHMHGSNKGQLTVYIRLKTSGHMQQIDQYFTTLKDAWMFGSSILTSNDSFQVVFEGRVVGQHSTDIGLDDITFTPQCQLRNPSTNRPGTTKLVTTANSDRATTKPGITTSHGATTKSVLTTSHGATTKSVITTSHGVTAEHGVTATGITFRSSVTHKTITVSTGTFPTKAGIAAASTSSDSWRVPVGVVLGLLAFVTLIAGVFIYLKRTRRLSWVTFPLLRKNKEPGDVNPLCELDVRR